MSDDDVFDRIWVAVPHFVGTNDRDLKRRYLAEHAWMPLLVVRIQILPDPLQHQQSLRPDGLLDRIALARTRKDVTEHRLRLPACGILHDEAEQFAVILAIDRNACIHIPMVAAATA